jgi:hypothetical protein
MRTTESLSRAAVAGVLLLTLAPTAFAVLATGGNATNNFGYYRIHTFTNSGTASNFVVIDGGNIEVLVVAGGGGGGGDGGGGGGAGGLIYLAATSMVPGEIAVKVGAGGRGGAVGASVVAASGTNSEFGPLIAIGGGGGASRETNGISGGSGGGGGASASLVRSGGLATAPGQGYNGGTVSALSSPYPAAGGGGAGGAGSNAVSGISGNGGVGLYFPQFADYGGSPAGWFAGGGGGSKYNAGGAYGTGGTGGGGAGGASGTAGKANTGGGGGGSCQSYAGTNGGSGIVIVRYFLADLPGVSNGVAQSLTMNSADLVGTLLATGASPTTVYAFWATNDCTTNETAWLANGAGTNLGLRVQGEVCTHTAAGLSPNTPYYFNFMASNTAGKMWGSVFGPGSFQTPPDWTVYSRKCKVTFAGYNRPATLTNFPALVVLSTNIPFFTYNDFLSTNADLRFGDSGLTRELPYEIEKWDANGASYVWVQVPQLTDTNTAIWAYWGRSGAVAPAYATNGTMWSNAFAGVWHLAETNGAAKDSTTNRNNGTLSASGVTRGTTGTVDGAYAFSNPASGNLDCGTNGSLDVGYATWEAWMYRTGGGNYYVAIGKGYSAAYWFGLNTANGIRLHCAGPAHDSTSAVPLNQWTHVVATWDGQNVRHYLNGAPNGTVAETGAPKMNATQAAHIAADFSNGSSSSGGLTYYFPGQLDEIRVSNIPRSSNWVWACWMNMASNGVCASSFNQYGQVESGAIAPPTVVNGAARNLTASSADLVGTLALAGSAPAAVYAFWATNDCTTNEAAWRANGAGTNLGLRAQGETITNTAAGLALATRYYFNFMASNTVGTTWGSLFGSPSFATTKDWSGFGRKAKVTFAGYNRSGPLTNFPALIVLSTNIPGFNYADFRSPPNGDLRFGDAILTNELNYEVESWNTNGNSYVWVQVPQLADPNTCVWAYWCNWAATTPAYATNGATWDANYGGVWHLAETNGAARDSTANRNNGTLSASGVTQNATGTVNGAYTFTRTSSGNLDCGTGASLDIGYGTWEAWAYPTDFTTGYGGVISKGYNSAYWFGLSQTSGKVRLHCAGPAHESTTAVPLNQWTHIISTWDGQNVRHYLNGVLDATVGETGAPRYNLNRYPHAYIAADLNESPSFFQGRLDEIRVSSLARSSNWVWACWMNSASNGTFAGSFNQYEPVQAIVVDKPQIANGAAQNVKMNSADLVCTLIATGTSPTTVYAFWATNDFTTDEAAWRAAGAGTNLGLRAQGEVCTNTAAGLSPNTFYYFNFMASNTAGKVWGTIAGSPSFATVGPPAVNNGNGATAPDLTAATLNGNLTSTTGHVYILWGTDPDNLANTNDLGWRSAGAFAIALTGLNPSAVYYYRSYATNDDGDSLAPVTNFTTLGWASFAYRAKVTFAGYNRPGTLTNFPALVVLGTNIAGFKYSDFLAAPNGDLRFSDATLTNKLNYEIESWDTNGNSYVWVQVPRLADNSTIIWVYWNNPSASQPAYTTNGATWTEGYAGVWHLKETSGIFRDSTANGNHGTSHVTASGKDGIAAGGQQFNGTSDFIDPGSGATLKPSAFTYECWIKEGAYQQQRIFMGCYYSAVGGAILGIQNSAPNLSKYHMNGGYLIDTNTSLYGEQWRQIVGTYANSNAVLYVDGRGRTNAGSLSPPIYPVDPFNIGRSFAHDEYFNGWMDEVRVSNVARSSNWIWACWMNIVSNPLFNTVGAAGENATRLVDNEPGATAVSLTSARLNGNLLSTGGFPTAVFVYWGPQDGGTNALAWAHTNVFEGYPALGPLSTNIADLSPQRMYFYRFAATSAVGTNWAATTASFLADDVTVQVAPASVDENDQSALFWIIRPAAATNGPLTVNYVLGGTATGGSDYTLWSNPTNLTLADGVGSAAVQVVTLPNNFLEANETVTLALTNGPYQTGAPDAATLTIANGQWEQRMQIVFGGYTPPGGAATLTNFPALVIFSNTIPRFRYADFRAGGSDLRFSDSNRINKLNYEIESWDTNGNSYVWVQVPRLVDSNTFIWAHWNNPAANPPSYTTNGATWTEGYAGVWHLKETSGPFRDSTANGNHGTNYVSASGKGGVVAGGQQFDGSDDYINPGNRYSLKPPALTYECWIKEGASQQMRIFMGCYNGSQGGGTSLGIQDDSPNMIKYLINPAGYLSGTNALNDGQWHHVVGTYANPRAVLYVDGAGKTNTSSVSREPFYPADAFNIGRSQAHLQYFNGWMDEVRVSNVARSSNWVWACWMNMASNSVFVQFSVNSQRGTIFMIQ